MPESRQQRRARERAERKQATRPGPTPQPPGPVSQPPAARPSAARPAVPASTATVDGPRPERFYDVEVTFLEADPNDPDDTDSWIAESGLRDDSVGIAHEFTEDLAELVADAVETAGEWSDRYAITIAWFLSGSEHAMQEAAAEAGVTLPRHPPELGSSTQR